MLVAYLISPPPSLEGSRRHGLGTNDIRLPTRRTANSYEVTASCGFRCLLRALNTLNTTRRKDCQPVKAPKTSAFSVHKPVNLSQNQALLAITPLGYLVTDRLHFLGSTRSLLLPSIPPSHQDLISKFLNNPYSYPLFCTHHFSSTFSFLINSRRVLVRSGRGKRIL